MPPLTDPPQPVPPAAAAPFRPVHPSPLLTGLGLEQMTGREIAYHGHVFGVDTPYLMLPLGWGEWSPLVGA